MPLDHQIAQKLHAVSGLGDRARDLIDLQLIDARAEVDLTAARAACRRLFSYRRAQAWPPVIAKRKGWDEMYAALAEGLPVLQDVDEAIRWANEFVARIEEARWARAEADGRRRPGKARSRNGACLLLLSHHAIKTS